MLSVPVFNQTLDSLLLRLSRPHMQIPATNCHTFWRPDTHFQSVLSPEITVRLTAYIPSCRHLRQIPPKEPLLPANPNTSSPHTLLYYRKLRITRCSHDNGSVGPNCDAES